MQLANIFKDGMILQRDKEVKIWGNTNPNTKIRATIQNKQAETTSDNDGKFVLSFDSLATSDKETLNVQDDESQLEIKDVAIGEVFLAGGQSNMEFPLRYEKYREEELTKFDDGLRFFDTPKIYYEGQDKDFDYSNVGIWRKANSKENLEYFTAVGYYFAKEIREDLNVPVGIVGCNWGGTRSCAWISEDTVKKVGPEWQELWDKCIEGKDMEVFWATRKYDSQSNAGNPCMDDFNKLILPKTPTAEEVAKAMMDMAQKTMASMSPEMLEKQKAMLGVVDTNLSPQELFAKSMEAYRKDYIDARTKPGILYEHMLKMIASYTIKGVIWYQGESDDVVGLQNTYTKMLEGLITDWRNLWNDKNLPFIEVQLPGWQSWMMQEALDYPTIRKCQEEVANKLNNIYMASISDAGEQYDIHPKDKKIVGHRLALLARQHIYNENILSEAPKPKSIKREGNKIVITMNNSDGLFIEGDKLNDMHLIQDKKELEFVFKINDNELILELKNASDDSILIKYARDNWYKVNLFNKANIPAIPFEARCNY